METVASFRDWEIWSLLMIVLFCSPVSKSSIWPVRSYILVETAGFRPAIFDGVGRSFENQAKAAAVQKISAKKRYIKTSKLRLVTSFQVYFFLGVLFPEPLCFEKLNFLKMLILIVVPFLYIIRVYWYSVNINDSVSISLFWSLFNSKDVRKREAERFCLI